ncbi:P-type cation exchange, alpha subunit of ATPase [Mollisia scopiformis]|uniref:P-type cation exchange, alpha subunit of ATPase n=1 Tax=Mollisia scopiformis TaxID=149040 RepID=A0A194X4V3_MOLSC|nr:P-type cation exchange, alpha subunit of ATPase [Mollisia scopiformis]KUJ15206.1 P-type cation exchange, alpha subunit of ATPase [Mollisia scopiformis]
MGHRQLSTAQSINSTRGRTQSIHSIPPVYTEKEKNRRKREQEEEKKSVSIDEHLLPHQDVAARYKTNINVASPGESQGLTSAQSEQLLLEHGPNILTPPKKTHPFIKYLQYLSSLFNLLLILAGVLEYILLGISFKANFENTYLGAILIAVAFINAFIEFYQQQKSQALLESFLNMIPAKCMAVRDGKLAQHEAVSLVPGDVVFVRMGDKTPADILVFSASDCKVDNSSLTGESEPQERMKDNDMRNPLEATNLMFNSTLCVSGEAYGIVIRTGDSTVLGQIANLTSGEEKMTSPLTHEIGNFVKIIATLAILTALIFFGVAFPVNDDNISLALNFAIGIFVAWVPEGLPATVTMLLTIAAKRMASQNVLVKDLQGVETLGAITLLATDKTGTLTRNQMTTTNVWTCGELYEATQRAGNEKTVAKLDKPGVPDLLHICALCCRVKFDRTDIPMKERQILGDATESGLIRYAADSLGNFDSLAIKYPKVFEIPFNSETKMHISIHKKAHANGPLTLYIKGAPERVWKLCNRFLIGSDGESVPLTAEHKQRYDETYEHMASQGHRVLGFAELLLPGDQYPEDFVFDKKTKNYPQGDFTFVGLASLQDPPKHGVREAIGRCRAAGIKVIMVTGDHPLTAEAIGRKINLMLGETKAMVAKRTDRTIEEVREDEYDAIVIHGEMIDNLTEAEWDNILWKPEIIFARTSPKHKLEIVRRAQSMGHIVGVTGDGVNDAPALKKADLGIAMNLSGSDVSKEAAAMILLDDNFASIIRGIEEGRLIFVNLKKSIKYTVSHITPEIIPNLLYVIVPIPLPLSAILILVIDLGFELIAALSFAWDPPETEDGLMQLPPRKPVTPETANIFRRRALRRTQSRYDEEAGVVIAPENLTKWQKLHYKVRTWFSKAYWLDRFENTGAEVLVDGNVLSWAYLEIGMLEAIGSTVAFFVVMNSRGITPYDAHIMQKGQGAPTNYWTKKALPYKSIDGPTQYDILAEAQSMYYWSIMTMQMFNLFACKTRLTLPFGKYMFSNHATFYCILAGSSLAAFIIYTPGVEVVFGTSRHLLPLYWLVPMGFGVVLISYAAIRMIISRKMRPIKWNPEVSGLQMFPTIHTFRSLSVRRESRDFRPLDE